MRAVIPAEAYHAYNVLTQVFLDGIERWPPRDREMAVQPIHKPASRKPGPGWDRQCQNCQKWMLGELVVPEVTRWGTPTKRRIACQNTGDVRLTTHVYGPWMKVNH